MLPRCSLKFNAPANLFNPRLTKTSILTYAYVRRGRFGMTIEIWFPPRAKLNVFCRVRVPSAISMYTNYRAQRGVLLSESNVTPTPGSYRAAHLVTAIVQSRVRCRKSRALVCTPVRFASESVVMRASETKARSICMELGAHGEESRNRRSSGESGIEGGRSAPRRCKERYCNPFAVAFAMLTILINARGTGIKRTEV